MKDDYNLIEMEEIAKIANMLRANEVTKFPPISPGDVRCVIEAIRRIGK